MQRSVRTKLRVGVRVVKRQVWRARQKRRRPTPAVWRATICFAPGADKVPPTLHTSSLVNRAMPRSASLVGVVR
jgi:hypothetical protein